MRKVSLDRIVSPSPARRPMTSSPQSASVGLATPGSKPISPVGSNNNTHSSFSEDSLVAHSRYQHHESVHHQFHHGQLHAPFDSPFTSPTSAPSLAQRWNSSTPYEPLSGMQR